MPALSVTQNAKRGLLVYVLLVVVLAVIVADAWILKSLPAVPQQALAILAIVFIFALWSLAALLTMSFRASPDGVECRFWPFSLRVPLKDITEVKAGEKHAWWRGLGVRMGWKAIAFASAYSDTVVITRKNAFFTTVIITPENPQAFADAIARLRQLA